MIVVVVLSRKCNINPDNVATPIAASLGDLTTLALLSAISHVFYRALGQCLAHCFITSSVCHRQGYVLHLHSLLFIIKIMEKIEMMWRCGPFCKKERNNKRNVHFYLG